MLTVTKPIVIVGTGRSGSTALHWLLSFHPDVAWLSGVCNRFPRKPKLNRWYMRAIDLPVIGNRLSRRFNPGESYLEETWRRWIYEISV